MSYTVVYNIGIIIVINAYNNSVLFSWHKTILSTQVFQQMWKQLLANYNVVLGDFVAVDGAVALPKQNRSHEFQ